MEQSRSFNFGRIVGGMILILVGAFFLLGQFVEIDIFRYGWPFFVIVPGIALFAVFSAGGQRAAPTAIPASIVTTVGVLLLFQNATNQWQSWAYAWTLIFPAAFGLGLTLMGRRRGNQSESRRGLLLIVVGLALFLAGAVFFEIVLNIGGFADNRVVEIIGPLLLILLGILLLFRRRPFAR